VDFSRRAVFSNVMAQIGNSFLIADGEEILLCKSNKIIKIAQIILNKYVFCILKISANLFGNLALTLSAQCLRIRALE
jgi:hypothetical protein